MGYILESDVLVNETAPAIADRMRTDNVDAATAGIARNDDRPFDQCPARRSLRWALQMEHRCVRTGRRAGECVLGEYVDEVVAEIGEVSGLPVVVPAVDDGRIQLEGTPSLVRAFPIWNGRSMFAHIRPVSRTATSRAD